jgi:preprotein translocase subunit YajC
MNASVLIPIVMIAAFYLLFIRPQQRRVRQQAQLLQALEVGDEIVTIGGIFATITRILDDRYEVEVADGSRLYILRSAVARRLVAANEPEIVADADDEGIE